MAGAPLIDIEARGLDEVRKALQGASKDLAKAQRRALKQVADKVASDIRERARAGTAAQAHWADAIVGTSTTRFARITIRRRGKWAGANTAFMGARPKSRTGWNRYSYRRNGPGSERVRVRAFGASPTPQFPAWVGNRWIAGKRGEGPYVLNPTIADNQDRINTMLERAYARAVNEALGGKGEP